MQPEQKLNAWLREQFRDADFMRIENTTESGVPDINICLVSFEVWVEAKVGASAILRKEQYAWGMRRAHAGGSCYVLLDNPAKSRLEIFLFPHLEVTPMGNGKHVTITSEPTTVIPDELGAKEQARIVRKTLFPAI